jgi:predicted transposase/invertase (TIGR01784 family)
MAEIIEKYVNPFTDFGFKKLFGEEPNKDLLLDFLNSLLPDQKITDLTYNRVDRLGVTEEHRKAIFDLYCENDKGERLIVELQKVKQKYFKDRSLYYSTFPIQEQAVRGSEWDFKLKAVYFIGILDFVFEDKDRDKTVVTEAKLMDTKKNEVFYDKLTFMYLQMPNFNKQETELQNHFEKWLFVLRYLSKLQDRPRALQEKIFEKLFAVAEIAKFKPEERMDYEESVKGYRDTKNSIDTAKEEGGEERAINIAREMIADKEPIEKIVKYTKLDKSFIEALIKEIESGK